MARILILGKSGFGKSTSIGNVPEYGITGLDPETTYVISVTSKPLPFKGSNKAYPVTTPDKLKEGRRVISNDAEVIAKVLDNLVASPFQTIVIDDTNYIMQDYYMDNALSKGWDAPKIIGYKMGKLFKAIEQYQNTGKNIIVLAHGEDVAQPDGRFYTKFKTTGKMVNIGHNLSNCWNLLRVTQTTKQSEKANLNVKNCVNWTISSQAPKFGEGSQTIPVMGSRDFSDKLISKR